MPPRASSNLTTFRTDRLRNPNFNFASDEEESVADAGTPEEVDAQVEAPEVEGSFTVNPQTTVPSTTLQGNVTYEDALAELRRRTEQQDAASSLNDFDPNVTGVTAFDDPEQTIRSILYGDDDPTALEREVSGIRSDITDTIGSTEEQLTGTRRRAEDTTGIGEKQQELADTNTKIARRKTRFRRELRAFERDAEQRDIAREFYNDEKAKLEADATAELADLYIVQNAQQGNVEAAKDYIDTAVNNRYRSIEIELKQKQAELAERIPRLEAEEKEEAQRLQLALQERERGLTVEREDARTKRELALQAAANGAGKTTINQITNAETVDSAVSAASPFIGLLERQAAARAASSARNAQRAKLVELAMAGDKSAQAQLGDYGEYLASIQNNAEAKQREEQFNEASQKIDLARRIKSNETGLNMNTGIVQNPLVGLATFTPPGIVAATAGFAQTPSQLKVAKENFQADIKSLVAPEALAELVRQKEAGATFGALSNQELSLLVSASQELAGHVVLRDDGNVNIIGSPTAVQEDIDRVINFYEKAQFKTNQGEFDDNESKQLNSILSNPN